MVTGMPRRTVLAALAASAVGVLTGLWRAAGPSDAAPRATATTSPTLPPLLPSPTPPTPSASRAPVEPRRSAVVVAVGDIVKDVASANRTGRLAKRQDPDLVLLLGDIQYSFGTPREFATEFAASVWADLEKISKPTPGNHEYLTAGAAGYFKHFGNPDPYYAFEMDCGWRGYSLNSEIALGRQVKWLRADLAEHPDVPVVAFWHRPRFSSGKVHGSNSTMQPLWAALRGRNGVVLCGHEHHYERFAPRRGLRQFVVGTGSDSLYAFGRKVRGSERRIMSAGVLRLTLRPTGYEWAFVNTDDRSLDKGSERFAIRATGQASSRVSAVVAVGGRRRRN